MSLYGVDSILTPWWGEATLQAQMDKLDRFFNTIKANGGNCVNGLIYSDPNLQTSIDFFTGRADMLITLNDAGAVPLVNVLQSASDLLHQKGMKYWIQLCHNWFADVANTLMDNTAKTKYNTQAQQIIQQLNPDIVTIVSEPSSPTLQATAGVSVTDQEITLYEDWMVTLANALRAVKPSIQIAVMGLPFWSPSRIVSDGLISRMPSGTMVVGHYYTTDFDGKIPAYYYHAQINYYYAPADGSTITVNVDVNGVPTPTVVNLAQAKTYLFADFDAYLQPCLNAGVPFMWEAMGCNTGTPNALQSTKDAMEYMKTHNLGWITSGNDAGGGYYAFPFSSPDTLSSFGQAMFSTNPVNPSVVLPYHDPFTNPALPNWNIINGNWNVQ